MKALIRKLIIIIPVLVLGFFLIRWNLAQISQTVTAMITPVNSANTSKPFEGITVAIDPGHGGIDPGGIGVSGVLEKDVNLSIALMLRDNLTQQGVSVVMTRDVDGGLYSETAKNKKKEDLANRIQVIKDADAAFVICIHQNSFTDPKYSGAQVFYYKESAEGAVLAQIMQAQLIKGVDPQNTRVPKSNMNYYMLKNSPVPMVIVECGFLTNAEEEALLGSKDYQRKMAWNMYLAIMQYINTQKAL